MSAKRILLDPFAHGEIQAFAKTFKGPGVDYDDITRRVDEYYM